MVTKKAEAATPPATIQKLLDTSGDDLVLVGGQALAFWVERYGISHQHPELPAISNDVDFLSKSAGDKELVRKLADAMHGQTIFPNRRALTALVGQAVLDRIRDVQAVPFGYLSARIFAGHPLATRT